MYQPLTPEPLWALTATQRRCMAPGAYASTGARLRVNCHLPYPARLHGNAVDETTRRLPFERLVVAFPADDEALLRRILDIITTVNAAACPDATSLASHALTGDQIDAAEDGRLNIVTGVHVLERPPRSSAPPSTALSPSTKRAGASMITPSTGGTRTFILEGLGGPGSAMEQLRVAIGRPRSTPEATYFVLANERVRFNDRLYTAFGLLPRVVRLRQPLAAIASHPATFDRQATSEPLQRCIQGLMEMRQAETLQHAARAGCFPSGGGVQELETSHASALTLADVWGATHPAASAHDESRARLSSAEASAEALLPAALDALRLTAPPLASLSASWRSATASPSSPAFGATAAAASSALASPRRSARSPRPPTAAASLSSPPRPAGSSSDGSDGSDAIARNIRAVRAASDANATRRLHGDERHHYHDGGDDDADAVPIHEPFTAPAYALNASLARDEEPSRWKTRRGFVYPAPKLASDYATHPGRPTDYRRQELAEPWTEAADADRRETALEWRRAAEHAASSASGTGFVVAADPTPLAGGVFGYVDGAGAPVPAHNFFRSVHGPAGGPDDLRAVFAAREAEEAARRVIVDDPAFHVVHSKDSSVVGRLGSLLQGEPRKLGLRLGAAPPAPMTITATGPWEPRTAVAATLSRSASDATAFLGKTATGVPVDFHTSVAPRRSAVYRPLRAAGLAVSAEPGGRARLPPPGAPGSPSQ